MLHPILPASPSSPLALFDVAPPTAFDSLPNGALLGLGALGVVLVIVLLVRRGARR